MAVWKVVIYTRPNGRSPFEEFREAVGTIEEAADIDVAVRQLSERGSQGLGQLRRAEKMNDVWQLRPGKHRVFYFWDDRNRQYVLLHGYRKQTRKTPSKEIQRAENLRRHISPQENGGRDMVSDALKGIRERLQDFEYRRAYGSTNIKYDLACALIDARNRAGYTQKQLADLSGVSQAYIAKLESGDANPTVGHIGALLATIWFRMEFKIEPLDTPYQWSESPELSGPRPSDLEDAVIDGRQLNPGTADARYHAFSHTPQAHRFVSTVS